MGPPPEQVLRKGMPVEVKLASRPDEKYPGKIASVDAQMNTYSVDYSDGTTDENVPRARVVAVGEDRNAAGVLFLDEAYDLDPANSKRGPGQDHVGGRGVPRHGHHHPGRLQGRH